MSATQDSEVLSCGKFLWELNPEEHERYQPRKVFDESFHDLRDEGVRDLKSYQSFEDNIFWGNGFRVPLTSSKLLVVGFLDSLVREPTGEWVVHVKRSFGGILPSFRARAILSVACLRDMGYKVDRALIVSPLCAEVVEVGPAEEKWIESLVALTRALLQRGSADYREIGSRACSFCPHSFCEQKGWLREVQSLPLGWSE